MRGQAYVPTRWWTERDFVALRPDAQRVLLCLWTAPEMPLCGVAPLSVATLADRLRIDVPVVNHCLSDLQDIWLLTVDPDAYLVWLHGYIDVQLGGPPASNEKWLKATVKALSCLPQTPMVDRFRRQYGIPHSLSPTEQDSPSVGYRGGIDTPPIDTSLPTPCPLPSQQYPDAPKFHTAAEFGEVAK